MLNLKIEFHLFHQRFSKIKLSKSLLWWKFKVQLPFLIRIKTKKLSLSSYMTLCSKTHQDQTKWLIEAIMLSKLIRYLTNQLSFPKIKELIGIWLNLNRWRTWKLIFCPGPNKNWQKLWVKSFLNLNFGLVTNLMSFKTKMPLYLINMVGQLWTHVTGRLKLRKC